MLELTFRKQYAYSVYLQILAETFLLLVLLAH